jgi:hypothetical protein
MTIDRSELRRVLLGEASSDVADRAMTVLEPTIVKAESGLFHLDGRHAVSDPVIRTAIMSALNHETARVARISLSEGIFSKPSYMTIEFYRNCLHAFLQDNIAHKLHYKLHDLYGNELKQSNSLFQTEQSFMELIGKQIRCGLKKAVRKTERCEKQWEDAWKEAYRAIQTVLVFYIDFAQMNDVAGMDKLEPLAKLIHRVVPYGCKLFERETRIVFVA